MLRASLAAGRSAARLLTSGGWSALSSGAALTTAGVVWNHGETLFVGATLLAVVVAALGWMLQRPALEASRTVEPAQVEEGEDARAVIRVHNPGRRRSPWVTGFDEVDGQVIRFAIGPVDPAGETRESFALATDRRGVHHLGPLTVAHADPFRLVRAGAGSGGRTTYKVWPRAEVVAPLPTGRVRDVEGTSTPRTAGSGVTFHNLREYVPGDDLRQIHWRSSARTGTLLVRQNVLTSEPRMVVFIDCRADAYDSDDRFDEACRVAASLLTAGVRGANPVELITSTGRVVGVDSSGGRFEAAMDLLATIRRARTDQGLAQLARLTNRRHSVASIAVITGDVPPGHAELLRAMQPRYASFHAIQMGDPGMVRALPMSASTLFQAGTVEDFVGQWGRRIDR